MNVDSPPKFHSLALFAVLFGVTLAGCMSTPDPDCTGDVCVTQAQPGDAFLTNATRDTASFAGCTGGIVGLDVPARNVAGHLPSEFRAVSSIPGTVNIRILAIDCPSFSLGKLADRPIRYALVAVPASPVAEDWQARGLFSEYAFELFVDHADAADGLAAWGLPAFSANISVTPTQTPLGQLDEWAVNAAGRSYSFSILRLDGESGGFSGPAAMWAGTETFHRVDTNRTSTSASVSGRSAFVGRASDATVIGSIVGTDTFPFTQQAYQQYSTDWRPLDGYFPRLE